MTTYEKIHKELCVYIDEKIPEIKLDTRLEIAMYAVNLFILREADVLFERDAEWKRLLKKEQTTKRG